MTRSIALKITLLVATLVLASANRPVPKWQSFGHVSLSATARCVHAELSRFGPVKIERGEKPEAGDIRLFLHRRGQLSATVYMQGDSGFSSAWMDADSRTLGNRIWLSVTRNCRIS
jgi:hypothetical protein